jgi:hypothetical protein
MLTPLEALPTLISQFEGVRMNYPAFLLSCDEIPDETPLLIL